MMSLEMMPISTADHENLPHTLNLNQTEATVDLARDYDSGTNNSAAVSQFAPRGQNGIVLVDDDGMKAVDKDSALISESTELIIYAVDSNAVAMSASLISKPSLKPFLSIENAPHSDDLSSDDEEFVANDPDNVIAQQPTKNAVQKKLRDEQAFASFLKKDTLTQCTIQDAQALGLKPRSTTYFTQMSMEKIIDSPREYQLELFERAKKQNTIIVLDTGRGKTLIAVLLIRHMVEEELVNRSLGKSKRIAFFLVEKVPLVHQQYHVIESNLSYPITRAWGHSSNEAWGKAEWEETVDKQMVVVCTTAILHRALASTYVKIDQINLIVFDEVHHAKKNHPYARIIKDFYATVPVESRPRILGMTASPVDSKEDVRHAAADLERLLCSTIASIDKGSFQDGILRHESSEHRVTYSMLKKWSDTELTAQILPLTRGSEDFDRLIRFAQKSFSELGPWCVDRFWKLSLSDTEAMRLLARCQAECQKLGRKTSSLVKRIRSAIDAVRLHEVPPLERSEKHLSSKTLALLDLLEQIFPRNTERISAREYSDTWSRKMGRKCIVFVEAKDTAMMLADLVKQPAIQHFLSIKSAPLFGASSRTRSMSYSSQNITIHKFRISDLNCLFATSVAEEGLDIPDCDTIIRFDLYHTMIQYVQSKGRARRDGSQYYIMMENRNLDHQKRVQYAQRNGLLLSQFCAQLPKNRMVESVNQTLQEASELQSISYTVQSTGARLGWLQSLEVLNNFAAHLVTEENRQHNYTPRAEYMIMPLNGKFYCHVILPEGSPVRSFTGEEQRSKADAKCSAAFGLCIQLIEKELINGYLEPVFKKKLLRIRNARLAISAKKEKAYNMKSKSDFWMQDLPQDYDGTLHGVLLALTDDSMLERRTKPLVLLARREFPLLPDITLFFGENLSTVAQIRPINGTIPGPEIERLTAFTLRVFRDVFSKDFIAEGRDLPYFIASSRYGHGVDLGKLELKDIIDWKQADMAVQHNYLTLDDQDPCEFYQEKFCIDPYDGGRKLYLLGVREDMHPLDPIPEGVPNPQYRCWKSVPHNIKEYSISMWGSSRSKRQWKDDQPVVEARQISLRRNLLSDIDDGSADRLTNVSMFIIMEPMNISTLSPSVVAMCGTFPAMIHRIEETLIALEASRMLDLPVRPDLALAALTKNSELAKDSVEEDQEPKFQEGMGENYERLEFLGDAFLKMATTIALFTMIPLGNEHEYHVERMLLICNINLFNTAIKMGLQEFIRTQKFNRRAWYPSGLKLRKGELPQIPKTHYLGDKSIADVCEAFIGAAYVSGCKDPDRPAEDSDGFDLAVKAVSIMVNAKNHNYKTFAEYYEAYNLPAWAQAKPTVAQFEFCDILGNITGYKFRNCLLLRSAFKHPSYPWEHVPNYQNLEFLGDALLDMCIIDFLYKSFPRADPQWLTEHKMAMASNKFLGCLSVELGFHKHILAVDPTILSSISEYIKYLTSARELAEELAKKTGKIDKNYWASEALRPPKCLADVVEAYIGSLFVDSGYSYAEVYKFFMRTVKPYFEDMALYNSFANQHPVTCLIKQLQGIFKCEEWSFVKQEQPMNLNAGIAVLTESQVAAGVIIHGQVAGQGKADGAIFAKVMSALDAMENIKHLSMAEFKEKFKCCCFVKKEGIIAEAGGESAEAQSAQ